ncbi:coiled-coil domain-containing protein 63-like [Heliangelus exortis]|uniref:coiled-coil domain-containing protein 63-like n=1 Tax=Heliangelus exortis TaxID=472823 RepID=UPI003A928A22
MPSLKQKLLDLPEKDEEKMAEVQMRRLQKKLKIGAAKKKSYSANVRQQMQAQEKELESLAQKHQEVSIKLSWIMRNGMLDARKRMKLQRFQETKDQYDALIRDRKAIVADLDNQIQELKKNIVRQYQAVRAKQMNSGQQLQKQIETLETQLNNVTVQFDTILTRNKSLREEIENMEIQKALLDKIYLKLHEKLDKQNRRMGTAVEESTRAHQQRMDTLAKMSDLKEKHNKDTAQYHAEMQEWQRGLAEEDKLKAFILSKWTNRSELEEEAKKKKALKTARWLKKNQGESLESREVVYRRLLELAEDGNIEELVNRFIAKEEKNYACFSYSTELNKQVEKLQCRIQALQDEIATLEVNQDIAKRSSLCVLQDLEEKLQKTTEEANFYEERYKDSSKVLGQLKHIMETLLEELDCDHTKIRKEHGEKGWITDQNLMQCLGLLEKKAKKLLMEDTILRYKLLEDSDHEQSFCSSLLAGSALLHTMDPSRLCPQPPAVNSTNDLVEALEVPLDHEQLRQLVLQSHTERAGAASLENK